MATKAIVSDTNAYAAIVKFEEQEDGTVLAYGKATDATLDADEQICDPDWLKRAMPEWFKYGNIREQHSSIAAGVATQYEETEDGHYITAHIVDPSSAKKIKTGVLKGFSIGIRRPRVIKDNKAAGGRIVDGQIVEISVVDRPANPSCMLTVAKATKGELKAVKGKFKEITKGSEDQPRDENGRFASSDGGSSGSDNSFDGRDATGERVVVSGGVEGEGQTGTIIESAPSGNFHTVELDNGQTQSYHGSDLEPSDSENDGEANVREVTGQIDSIQSRADDTLDLLTESDISSTVAMHFDQGRNELDNARDKYAPEDRANSLYRAADNFRDAANVAEEDKTGNGVVRELRELSGNCEDLADELTDADKYLKSISTKENIMRADAILEMSKEWAGSDVVKFDQAAFDSARRALATLIQVEAGEMGEGHDETHSLTCLLNAVHALMEWREGEAYEGEVAHMPAMEEMEMSIEPESVKEAEMEAEMCKECGKAMEECKCKSDKAVCEECGEAECDCKTYSAEMEEKCLECGCHQPADNHGRDDVTTAVVVSDKSDTPEVSDIKAIVEDIVKALLPNPVVGEEIEIKAADSERIEALEAELAQVKSLAAPSGPKRFAAVSNNTTTNVNKAKAAIYRAKAAQTLDKSLANGYLALAIDLEKSES